MFGHVMKKKGLEAVRMVLEMNIERIRRTEIPKKRWLCAIKNDMKIFGVSVYDVNESRVEV